MISINASYTNLVNQRTLATNTNALHKATERLATGARINNAVDDAAGLFVGSALASSISSRKIALDNTMLASNFLNIADGALSNVSDNLMRMNQLATQACNGFMSTEARQTLQAELDQMKANITQTIGKADMNGVSTIKKTGMSADLMVEIDVQTEEQLKRAGYVECTAENLADGAAELYINSAEQLQALATYTNGGTGTTVGKTFILTADIDLSSVCSAESDVSWEAIGQYTSTDDTSKAFKGTFNGNGHIVSNLYINKSSSNYQGLFGYTYSATIKNIGIENADITGKTRIGAIVGASDNSAITNTYSTGKIFARDVHAGGVIGRIKNSNIENSYSKCDVRADSEINSSGYSYAGGLIGGCISSNVSNVFATGNVNGKKSFVGGLIGDFVESSTLQNAYATGNVSSAEGTYVGGLLGHARTSCTIENTFATGNISGYNMVGGLIGMLESESVVANSFAAANVNATTVQRGLLIGTLANSASIVGTNLYYSTDATLNGQTSNKVIGFGAANCSPAPTGASLTDLKSTIDWSSWDTDIWDLSGDMPTFKARSTATSPAVENISFQISDGYDENASIDYDCALTLNLINLDLSTVNSARRTLGKIQELLTTVNEKRSYIGTQLNRLSGIATASQMTIENYSAARSTVMDTDIAQEVANMTRAQILQQISVSVLSQSKNVEGQIVLSLIR